MRNYGDIAGPFGLLSMSLDNNCSGTMANHNTALEPWSYSLCEQALWPITNDKLDLGSSTELITLKPWDPGKQLPLGFSVLGQATSHHHHRSTKKSLKHIYPDHPPLVYRILKDLSRKLFSLIHKKRFDKDAVIGYYGTY